MSSPVPVREPRSGYPESGQGGVALVLGILSVVLLPLLGPIAWWLAVREKRAIAAGRRDPNGRGVATAGQVLGIIGTVLFALLIALFVALVVGGVALFRGVDDATYTSGGDGSREEWVAAIPRQGEGYAEGRDRAPDRCSLAGWFADQLTPGMSSEEVVAAVGEPDSVETGAPPIEESWRWDLGLCTLDYDVYVVDFSDGSLVDVTYVQG